MSLHGHSKPESGGSGLSRSKSCGGLLAHQRSAFLNSDISGSTTSLALGSVLGHKNGSTKNQKLLQNLSATWSGKPPKIPRPDRTFAIFHALTKGLNESIQITKNDIAKLKEGIQDISANSPQQLRAAERYLKRLEFQLLKIEEIREKYEIQYKMRDGVRTMQHAYARTANRDAHFNNIKMGLQECTDVLCTLEAELEHRMGTLNFYITRIQGFARLCPGDVYDITLKHGDQKVKTRARVLKEGKQEWDCQQFTFKALLEEVLFIKAVEIRSLSKSILLGNKYCETKELFSAFPQMMTVVLNASGSLKLNLIVTWNPLHGCLDDASPKPLPSVLALFTAPTLKKHDTLASSPEELSQEGGRQFSTNGYETAMRDSGLDGGGDSCAESLDGSESLLEVIHALSTNLEDLQGQYPILEGLEKQVLHLRELLGVNLSRRSSADSNMSLSVQSALGYFDFLEEASEEEDSIENHSRPSKVPKENALESKTADSGIESLSRKPESSRKNSTGTSTTFNPNPTTGWDQLDLALFTHLLYCQRLLENVGLFGPFKFREQASLEKLASQATVLEKLIGLIKPFQEQGKIASGVSLLQGEELQHLWSYVTGGGEPLCLPVKQLVGPLEHHLHLFSHSGSHVGEMAKILVRRILDTTSSTETTEDVVTVLQVETTLGSRPLLSTYEEIAHFCKTSQALSSSDVYLVKSTLNSLERPPKEVLWLVGRLVAGPNPALSKLAEAYLKKLAKQPGTSKMVRDSFMEGLESDDEEIRRGSCRALALIEALEAIDALAHIFFADESSRVQQEAKNALFYFGPEMIDSAVPAKCQEARGLRGSSVLQHAPSACSRSMCRGGPAPRRRPRSCASLRGAQPHFGTSRL